jgi:hypothetical protein
MAVLTVGSGQQFSTLKAAIAVSHDGDTIYVEAGIYVNDFCVINTDVDIIGVGGMAHFVHDGSVPIPNGKAIFVTNADVTFDHIELSGAKVPDQNGAGIKYQAGNLTVTNCYFHNNQNGILSSSSETGTITIDRSEFGFNGAGDGYSHNLYVSTIDKLTITNSYFHDASVGHEIKSRAETTVIMSSRILDLNGTASYSIDLPSGGSATIQDNFIQQGPYSKNGAIINFGSNASVYSNSSLLVSGNTIVNQLNTSSVKGIYNRTTTFTAQITDNDFYGLSPTQVASGLNVQSSNTVLGSVPSFDTSHPWTASPWDELVSGGTGDDVLTGTNARDLLVGGAGGDTFQIKAVSGSDTIADFGTSSGDVVMLDGYGLTTFAAVQQAMITVAGDTVLNLGDGKTLTLIGVAPGSFAADDFVMINTGTSGTDPFQLPTTGESTNTLTGTVANDVLIGTASNDHINGLGGADTMIGAAGDDLYHVNKPLDVVVENANEGTDTVISTMYAYTLPVNVENLELRSNAKIGNGNDLDNIITSNNSNDTLDGRGGNDVIIAKAAAYVLTGGAGDDIFLFTQSGQGSRITDFDVNHDLLDLRPLISATGYLGSDPISDGIISFAPNINGDVVVALANNGSMIDLVTLVGVTPSELATGSMVLMR